MPATEPSPAPLSKKPAAGAKSTSPTSRWSSPKPPWPSLSSPDTPFTRMPTQPAKVKIGQTSSTVSRSRPNLFPHNKITKRPSLLTEDGLSRPRSLPKRLYRTVVIGDNPTYVLLPLQLISVILSLAANQNRVQHTAIRCCLKQTFNRHEPYPCSKSGLFPCSTYSRCSNILSATTRFRHIL